MRIMKSDTKLIEASKHVTFEIDQLDDCVKRLLQKPERLLQNSLLTAFSIYTRNLYKFLYAHNPSRDEIIAEHYFEDPNLWIDDRPSATQLLQDMAGWADKTSAHLTYDRIKLNPWWLWLDAHDDFRNALRVFATKVPENRVVPELLYFEQRWRWSDGIPRRP